MEDHSEDFLEVYDINDILDEPNTESDPLVDLLKRFDLMIAMPFLKGKLQLIITKLIFLGYVLVKMSSILKSFHYFYLFRE